MPVGVVDVGSNTVRLVVARAGQPIRSERAMLRLGADIEAHGLIPAEKLALTASVVSRFADLARADGADRLEILITSPGRQAANGAILAATLEAAAGCPARILSAVEEGRLAFAGAVDAASPPPRRTVAVVDVGGGSAQLVIGSRRTGPTWVRSIDLGSQRLTSRLLNEDPPGLDAVRRARAEAERYVSALEPPPPRTAFAVGGSARALKRLERAALGPDELEHAIELLTKTPTKQVALTFGLDEQRARTLLAGALILRAVQDALDVPLEVVRGGLRDGALAELAARRAAA
jgi:exopolyphosphatase / guanosine-5'-triphosphate,3'-diphosphate pyrophosphatase